MVLDKNTRLMSRKEVAARLGITPARVTQADLDQRLEPLRTGDGHRVWDAERVEAVAVERDAAKAHRDAARAVRGTL